MYDVSTKWEQVACAAHTYHKDKQTQTKEVHLRLYICVYASCQFKHHQNNPNRESELT